MSGTSPALVAAREADAAAASAVKALQAAGELETARERYAELVVQLERIAVVRVRHRRSLPTEVEERNHYRNGPVTADRSPSHRVGLLPGAARARDKKRRP